MARYAKFFSLGGGGGGTNNLQLPVGTILDTTLRQVQDGLGTGSPLYISTLRVGITSDPSVTTQVSSVIQATTTNASLVIAPNGTGALVASIPDGTNNARGSNAVDLQMVRSAASHVASGVNSNILGGSSNTASGSTSTVIGGLNNQSTGGYSISGGRSSNASGEYSIVIGGNGNTASGNFSNVSGGQSNTSSGQWSAVIGGTGNNATGQSSVVGGQSNTASSNYSVVSGGLSNTASTNTHATVVGGFSNTATGLRAIAGGDASQATGNRSIAFGEDARATGNSAAAIGGTSIRAIGSGSISLGGLAANATSQYSLAQGYYTQTQLLGQISFAGGSFTNTLGQCQQSLLTSSREAALNSAATTVLSLDGTGTTNLIIPSGNNRLWAVKVVATAFVSVAGGTLVLGDSYMGEFTLLFKRVGGTSSVVGVNSANLIYDTNMATAAFTFAAGASQDLQITFKAPTTASATTFRCVAKVELVEVAY